MDMREKLLRPTWIEIDLDAIKHNTAEIKKVIGKGVKLIPVLKGNAYGCGLLEVVETLCCENIYGFGAGNIYEAIEVRKNCNLLVVLFGNTLKNAIPEILRHNITPSVSDLDWIKAYSDAADDSPAPVFVKVDVGLNRLGVPYTEASNFFREISHLPNIRVDGIMTHIALPKEYIEKAFDRFCTVVTSLEKRGFNIPVKLTAHSQLIGQFPSTYLNAVDPGKMIYGIMPYEAKRDIHTKPAFSKLVSKIIHIKKSVEDSPENYERIGVVPIGMADGLPSAYSKQGEVLVKGNRAPIIKVHAEHTRVNLSNSPRVQVSDEVIFIGHQGNEVIDFYEVAEKCNTTESELLRSVSRCLPRVYIRRGTPNKIASNFSAV